MREIKFRVWNDFIKKYETLQEVASRGAIMPRGNELKTTVNYPLIIEQFTGLHDKNGVEIYEGDIVHITKGLGNFANKKGQVVFTEGAFHIEGQGFTLSFAAQYGLKVIGNIHEEVGE